MAIGISNRVMRLAREYCAGRRWIIKIPSRTEEIVAGSTDEALDAVRGWEKVPIEREICWELLRYPPEKGDHAILAGIAVALLRILAGTDDGLKALKEMESQIEHIPFFSAQKGRGSK